jgi:predicted  nucleic acid-binding Zn-ribbon protein
MTIFTVEQFKQLSDFLIDEFKEVFATKEDLKELKDQISEIQTTMDGIAKLAAKHDDEIPIMGSRIDRVESWVQKAAPKIGLKYRT